MANMHATLATYGRRIDENEMAVHDLEHELKAEIHALRMEIHARENK